jgi:hypothetical protein
MALLFFEKSGSTVFVSIWTTTSEPLDTEES